MLLKIEQNNRQLCSAFSNVYKFSPYDNTLPHSLKISCLYLSWMNPSTPAFPRLYSFSSKIISFTVYLYYMPVMVLWLHTQVLLLRRKTSFHSSYNWFSGYCGSGIDFDNLLDFAGLTSFKTTTKLAPNLLDEFAPVIKLCHNSDGSVNECGANDWLQGILMRMWEKITEIYYQVYDSATANSWVSLCTNCVQFWDFKEDIPPKLFTIH